MAKSSKFRIMVPSVTVWVPLGERIEVDNDMTKKKKKTKPTKEGGLRHFLASPQFGVVRGAFYVLLAFFAVVATLSFIFKLFFPGDNPDSNLIGSFGRWMGETLVCNTFGIASLGLCFLLFVYGMRLVVKNRSGKPEQASRPSLWGDDRRFRKCLWCCGSAPL